VSLHEQDRDHVELVGRGGVELTRTSQVSFFLERKDSSVFHRRSFRSSADFEPGAAGPPY
jgi:hypothetical protein